MAKLDITRFPGESDEEWTRRHSREKMRIYRARKPKSTRLRGPDIGRRKNAAPLRDEFPQMEGETWAEWDKRIRRIRVGRRRAEFPEEMGARRRELYAQNGKGDAKIAWEKANPDKVAAYARDYFEKNKEKRLASLSQWGKDNPARIREVQRAWFAKHRDVMNAANGKYRARAFQATPAWVDWRAIWRIYTKAKTLTKQTGIPHQVDHIYPLNGKTVSGLHVHHNLQILTKEQNLAKRNYLPEEVEA